MPYTDGTILIDAEDRSRWLVRSQPWRAPEYQYYRVQIPDNAYTSLTQYDQYPAATEVSSAVIASIPPVDHLTYTTLGWQEAQALLEQYAPFVWLAQGEKYFPTNVEWYFQHCYMGFEGGGTIAYSSGIPTTTDPVEGILAKTWRPALSVVGAAGLPALAEAGNVLRPKTALKLSMRLPPTVDAAAAIAAMKQTLEADPPYRARVSFNADAGANGWNAPPTAQWLRRLADEASQSQFGRAAAYTGEGGTIPFMNMLGLRFPQAQYLITGVLGPQSNAHGPNEYLHIPYVKKLTAAVAQVIAGMPDAAW